MSRNKYGLSRDIPSAIKREIRIASGFGCVICGASIVDYEHVDPPFEDAREHNPSKMTLLCPQHHSKVTRRMLSKQTVKGAMANPKCKQVGYASEVFDIGWQLPNIVFAGQRIENCRIPIQIRDFPVIEIKEAEVMGGPFRLGANFFDSIGRPTLRIIDNEWFAFANNWDVETEGSRITVRAGPRQIALMIRAEPPDRLIVEKVDMFIAGYRVRGGADRLFLQTPDGSSMSLTGGVMSNANVGIQIS